jgi:uncharacterized protein (DUF1501 family)
MFATALDARPSQAAEQRPPSGSAGGNILVLLELAGGNDGLNTVVPLGHDDYLKARPTLAVSAKKALRVNDQLGLHPSLASLKALYDEGLAGIILGVGYPEPSRSHARSTRIWQTAGAANSLDSDGWIGRFVETALPGSTCLAALSVARSLPRSFAGKRFLGSSVYDASGYQFVLTDKAAADEQETNEKTFRELNAGFGGNPGRASGAPRPRSLAHVEQVAQNVVYLVDQIRALTARGQSSVTYPATSLGRALKLVAGLIAAGLPTRVFHVSQSGYDTHINQSATHDSLLKDLGDSMKAFLDDLKAQGNLGRVLVMTYSEFGRRVAENASGGTDHGTASTLFVAGGAVRAGVHGRLPSIAPADLDQGDLRFTTDFRSVYAGVLEGWFKTPSEPILGRKFEPIRMFI